MKTTLSRLISLVILFSLSAGMALNPLEQSQAAPGSADAAPQSAWGLENVGHISGPITAVDADGNYAYVGDGDGLTILDISNPALPMPVSKTLSQLPYYIYVTDVDIVDDLAYVSANANGLRVLDVSDPANPVEIGFHIAWGVARDAAIAGSYAYVAYDNALRVLDISNPASPVEVGAFSDWYNLYGVAVSGNYVFLVDALFGLAAVDISNPADPILVDTLSMSATLDVAVSGSYAYTANDSAGLTVVDISDPANMIEVGLYDTPGYAHNVAVSGNYAYVADKEGGLRVLDISDPPHPVEVGSSNVPVWAIQVDVSGDYAYVADELGGLWIVNVSNPAAPLPVGAYLIPPTPENLIIAGNYAYVANYHLGLLIMDISDPTMPLGVGWVDTPGSAYKVAVSGNYAYVADIEGGLRIIDIANPAAPVEVGFYLPGEPADVTNNVTISGSYAYVTVNAMDGSYGSLRMIDISTPSNPVQVGFYDSPSYPTGVAVVDNYAYLVDYENGLLVLDISDPANPLLLGSCDTPGSAFDVAISGDHAFVADYDGLQAIDISDPANPIPAGSSGTPYVRGVVISGDYAYVWTDYGPRVLDISNPAQPVEVSAYDMYDSFGLAVSGSYIYAGGWQKLYVLRFIQPLEYLGFQPTWNGYSFANYGAKEYGDYTISDMQRMFGESTVCWMVGSGCEAKAQASLWNVQNYQMMNEGHSYGMAVSGLRFLKDIDLHPATASVNDLDKLDDVLVNWGGESITTTLRRDIGFFTVSQFSEPLRSDIHQALEQTPAQVYAQLEASMMGDAPDPLVLFMFSEGRGHALTPYAITSPSSGVYHVWVYDSESSGDMERAMIFDTNADTWSYDTGNGVWGGDASSHSLGVIPMSAHSQALECPWCASRLQSASTSHLLTMEGNGHLLVTDSQGRQLVYLGSQYVEEIPGGYGSVPLLGIGVTHEPLYTLPLTETYTILLDGQTVSQTSPSSLWQFGPGYATSLQDVNVGPGTQDRFSIGSSGTLLGYHASQPQEPVLILALDILSATYGLDIQWIDIGAGEAVTLTADTTEGKLTLDGSQASGGMYNLLIRKASEAGGFPFYHNNIEILATDTHILHFGAWDGYGAITLEIDHGSDGTIDETITLVNEVVWAFLPSVSK